MRAWMPLVVPLHVPQTTSTDTLILFVVVSILFVVVSILFVADMYKYDPFCCSMSLFLRFWQVRNRHVHQRRWVVQPESVVVVDSGRPPTATVDDAGGGAGGGSGRVSVVVLFFSSL